MDKLTPTEAVEAIEVCEKIEQEIAILAKYISSESASQPWNIVSIQIFADIYRKVVFILERIQEIRGALTNELVKAVLPPEGEDEE